MNRVPAIVALAVLALAPAAQAELTEQRPYIYGGYTYTLDDDVRGSDVGQGYHLGAARVLNPHWDVAFDAFSDRFDGATRWRSFGGGVDALFHYSRARLFSPYLVLGAGAIDNTLKGAGGGSSRDPYVSAGLGFFRYFDVADGDLAMRVELRGRWVDLDELPAVGDLVEPVARLSLVRALGERPVIAAPSFGPDADGDGVSDDADLCPTSERGAKVDARGCPPDSDGDGIADDSDACPQTPRRTQVLPSGCPVPPPSPMARSADADGDGVPDARDRCPGTLAGLRVDADGCVREAQTVVLPDVTFATGSHRLTREAEDVLARIAEGLAAQAELRVEIAGHTDSVGGDAANRALSQRRADAVRQFLVARGIAGARLVARGYGEAQPVADNRTRDGRARNRRVEFRVTQRTP